MFLGFWVWCFGRVAALLVDATGLDVAYADSSNGKGNGGNSENAGNNGNGGTNNAAKTTGSNNGNGALASELKGMNAVHANPNALKNADPNSQVGKIAAYQNAALATQAAELAVETAASNFASAPNFPFLGAISPTNRCSQG